MGTLALYTRFWHALSERGVAGAIRDLIERAGLHRFSTRAHDDQPKHPFDREHHVDTGGLMYADELFSGHEHDMKSAGYYASAPSLVRGAIARWEETLARTGPALEDYSLLDIGCGKGRVVMLGSEFPFRAIVGVELNAGLAKVARRNLRKWMRSPRACNQVSVVHDDALSLPFPEGPVVIYFFNSFEREMVELLLPRLVDVAAKRSEPIDLIYVHPEFEGIVRSAPGMQVVAHCEIAFTTEESAADAFGVGSDECVIYRMKGKL